MNPSYTPGHTIILSFSASIALSLAAGDIAVFVSGIFGRELRDDGMNAPTKKVSSS